MDATYTINAIRRRVEPKEVIRFSVASVGIYAAFAVMLLFKSFMAFDVYMACLIPLIAYTIGIYTYCSYRNSNMALAFATTTLNAIGFSLMCLVSPDGIVIKHVVAMAASILIFAAVKFLSCKLSSMLIMIATGLASVLLYVVLLFQPEVNGVKAWLVIGGVSVQLTELIKLMFIVFLAVLYSSKYKESIKLSILIGCLIINMGFSVLISEYGSLLVLLVAAYMAQLIFGARKQTIILTVLAVLGIIAVTVLVITLNGKTDNEQLQYAISRLIGRILGEDTYQIDQAKKAIINGGLFGANKLIYVPVDSSDFAFTSLAQHMGLIVGAVAVIFFIGLIYLLAKDINLSQINTNSIMSVVSVLILSFQSVYIIMSNMGLVPITGINCIFLSDGGTSIMVSYTLILFIVNGLAKERTEYYERTQRRIEA